MRMCCRELLFAIPFIVTCLGGLAQAHELKAGPLTIAHLWVRAVPGSKVAAGYLTITNTGSSADRLIGGTLTGAARVEVHVTSNEGGITRMRPVEGGIEVKPHQTVKLAPGGFHLMLMDLKGSFVDGELDQGALQFEKAGTVPVEFEAQPMRATSPSGNTRTH